MRAERLLSILLLLQNNGKQTTRQLADKLEVSDRTIFRDIEALSAAGIPVYSERGPNGGWMLSEGYRTNLTGMRGEEILSLLLVNPSHLLSDLGVQEDFESAFQKLLAETPSSVRKNTQYVLQRIHIDGAGWHKSHTESVALLPIVQEAVWKDQKLWIQYKREEALVERIVNPLGLVAKRQIWYLVAESEDEKRTYRISRFCDARLLDERFKRPEEFVLADYWEWSTSQFKSTLPKYPATIRLHSKLFQRLSQTRFVSVIEVQPNETDWMQVEVEFETIESSCEIVLGFGPLIEVLAPSHLREAVREHALAIVALYNENK